jgi:hypothetical protein
MSRIRALTLGVARPRIVPLTCDLARSSPFAVTSTDAECQSVCYHSRYHGGHATADFTLGIYTHPTQAMTAPLVTTAEAQLGETIGAL